MNKKLICGSILVLVVVTTGLGLGKILGLQRDQMVQQKPLFKDSDVLESVFYEQLLNLVSTAPEGANLQAQLSLESEEFVTLQVLAQQCRLDIARQDAKAKPIIDEFRARAERVKRKEDLPPPPPILQKLQEERNRIPIRYKEVLRNRIGKLKFGRLDQGARGILKLEVLRSPSSND